MAKKKHENDATADFFGESDLDWLDDEEDAEQTKSVPPPVASETVPTPSGSGPLSSAPTLVFSSVPTLPPGPSPLDELKAEPEPAAPAQEETDVVPSTPPPPVAVPASSVASVTIPPPMPPTPPVAMARVVETPAPAAQAAPPPSPPAPEVPVPGAVAAVAAVATAAAAVSSRPQMPKISSPAKAAALRAAASREATPASRERTTEGWRSVLKVLAAEAEHRSDGGQGLLFERAARVAAHQVGDPERSVELYGGARAADQATAALLRNQGEVLGRLGRYAEQLSLLTELGESVEQGPPQPEAMLQAGLVAWRRLNQPGDAVGHLRRAADLEPENYTARALLRALIPAVGGIAAPDRLKLLDELASLAEGGIAADAWLEAAGAAEEAGDPVASRDRLQRALDAEPGHTGAFLRLERALANDPASLATLFEGEAARDGQTEPGWWQAEAARAHQRAANTEAAVRGFNASVEAGYPFALRELQGNYVQAGAWFDLEDALSRESEALSPEDGQAFTLYRLGWLREALIENHEAALDAYQRAVKADPTSAPAADAVGRLLRHKHAEQRAFWRERLEQAQLPAERRFLTLQLAEAAEADGENDKARDLYQAVLADGAEGTAAELSRAGLARVLVRLGDRNALADLRRAQAAVAATPGEKAMWLHEAAAALSHPVRPWPPGEPELLKAALQDLSGALEIEPDHPAGLGAITMLLEATDQWTVLAAALQAAGDATDDPHRRAAYLYRAGRLFAEQVQDDGAARACLGHALLADPAFRPARWLLRTVSTPGDATDASIYREEAKHAEGRSERAWGLFAAAEAAGPGSTARRDLQRILSESPDHAGALSALEVHCVAEGDEEGLTNIYLRALEGTPTRTKARIAARAAVLLGRAGKNARALEVLRRIKKMDVEGRPLRASARLALRLGDAELALELLDGLTNAEDAAERARLESAAGRPADALPVLLGVLDANPQALGVAARSATMAQQVGDADAMLKAYAAIARNASRPPLAAAYGSWTGMQLQGAGKDAEALEFWRIALGARPGSEAALNGVVRGLVATGDIEGLCTCLAEEPPERLAEALADAGDPARAAAVLAENVSGFESTARKLAGQVVLEQLHEDAGDWQKAYDVLVERRELCSDPRVLVLADEKIRYILAEHLAETDAAWTLYQQLHDDAPSDRGVTEALARIAGARGEIPLAIGYLRELANTATAPDDAARYQRRVGEVHERANQTAEARQAYFDALEHLPTDTDALDGLKRLAEAEKDWPALVSVLDREAGITDGPAKIELLRRIAHVNEDKIQDASVAIDSWLAVIALAPQDREGLDHLLKLSEDQSRWEVFVDAGDALAQILQGPDRGALYRRVGIACEDHLGRDDAAVFYQKAVSVAPPDYLAARRLEGLARSRADWPSAVRALALQSQAQIGEDDRVAALLSAATIEVEARHDRDAAAKFYHQILEMQPSHEPALRFMSSHLFESGQFDEAMPICQRLEPVVERGQDLDDFDTRMELSSFYFYFAEMLRQQVDHAEALPRYERALELNPTHLPSLEAVGPLYTEAEQWKQAERVYRSLLQLSGGHGNRQEVASTYTALGLVERQLDNVDKAYKRFNKALELHPNHVGALKGMALVLEDRSDWSNLLNVYNNIIYHATVPEDVIDAYMTKGRILDLYMQRQDKAGQHYQRSLDFDPHQPLAYLRLAELALRRDAHREAGQLAEKALQLDEDLVQPHRAVLLLVRAAAWVDTGRNSEAERCLREAIALDRTLPDELGNEPLGDPERLKTVVGARIT